MKRETLADIVNILSDEREAEYLSEVRVLDDLERYMAWLSEAEAETAVTSHLRRYKKRKPGLHPSSACKKGVCLLKLYFECTYEVAPLNSIDNETQRIFDIGTLLHDMYQTFLGDMYGDQFRSEVFLSNKKYLITSHTDGVLDFEKVRFILEMKSIKEGGNFGYEKVIARPMEDNIRQAHFYMWLADIPYALILYINKNSGKLLEHAIRFDWTLWEDIYGNVVKPVVDAVSAGKKPPASPGYGCRYCSFKHSCKSAGRVNVRGTTSSW